MPLIPAEHDLNISPDTEAYAYLEYLCNQIHNRCVGSPGNKKAVEYFRKHLEAHGWNIEESRFDAMNWHSRNVSLHCGNVSFDVCASPYSKGCDVIGELAAVTDIEILSAGNFKDKILLLYGDIAKEQLIPKNFEFFQSPEHQRIINLLECCGSPALICATGMNAAMAGGVYPFPLIEDGDFDIPSVYMKDVDGERLLHFVNQAVHLKSDAERIPSTGANILGRKGANTRKRIVISAHIDAKQGTPGAIDNAAGVVVLMLIAEKLKEDLEDYCIDLIAFNGEDYYSVPGQMSYLYQNRGRFDEIVLNINIDCAGYRESLTAFSPMNLPDKMVLKFNDFISVHAEFIQGIPWYQGDHSLFLQNHCPAIAVSSQWFLEHMETQTLTHTAEDAPGIVDCQKLVKIAEGICTFLHTL